MYMVHPTNKIWEEHMDMLPFLQIWLSQIWQYMLRLFLNFLGQYFCETYVMCIVIILAPRRVKGEKSPSILIDSPGILVYQTWVFAL